MGTSESGLAPVTPLFAPEERSSWRSSWGEAPAAGSESDEAHGSPADEARVARDTAERALLKRLRGRSLSVIEARRIVTGHVDAEAEVEALLARFLELGYLDDAALAEQLTHTAVERKGQGRRVIAQALAQRGIPRDVADAALADLPDDDAERARDFARSKARSMSSLDRETALRRLSGQLARRGYAGSVSLDAARTALDELRAPSGD